MDRGNSADKRTAYTIYWGRVFNADAWHPSIVDAVCEYLRLK